MVLLFYCLNHFLGYTEALNKMAEPMKNGMTAVMLANMAVNIAM